MPLGSGDLQRSGGFWASGQAMSPDEVLFSDGFESRRALSESPDRLRDVPMEH